MKINTFWFLMAHFLDISGFASPRTASWKEYVNQFSDKDFATKANAEWHSMPTNQEGNLIEEATNGNIRAQVFLGMVHYTGRPDVPQSYHKAFRWLKAAARENHPVAYELLGVMYKNGQGCEKNYEKALESFNKAIENGGRSSAWLHLANMHHKGKGVPKNDHKALHFFYEGMQRNPELKKIFELIYVVQNDKEIMPYLANIYEGKQPLEKEIKLHKDQDNCENDHSYSYINSKEVQAAFKIFCAIIDKNDYEENNFLQLIFDNSDEFKKDMRLKDFIKILKKICIILEKPIL
jgi:TPR repeat protein